MHDRDARRRAMPRATRSSRVLSEIATKRRARGRRSGISASSATHVERDRQRRPRGTRWCRTGAARSPRPARVVHHGVKHGTLLMSSIDQVGRGRARTRARSTPGTTQVEVPPRRRAARRGCRDARPRARRPGNRSRARSRGSPRRTASSRISSRWSSAPPASGCAGIAEVDASRCGGPRRHGFSRHGADDVAGVERPARAREPRAQRRPSALATSAARAARAAARARAPRFSTSRSTRYAEPGHHPLAVGAPHLEPGSRAAGARARAGVNCVSQPANQRFDRDQRSAS